MLLDSILVFRFLVFTTIGESPVTMVTIPMDWRTRVDGYQMKSWPTWKDEAAVPMPVITMTQYTTKNIF